MAEKNEKNKNGLSRATIGELLDRNAERYPDQDAVVFVDKNLRYTWSELKKVCDKAANGFINLGIKKGDHIAIWGKNIPEWLVTQFAAAKIGAVLVTVNPEFKSIEQLGYTLNQSYSNTIILMEKFMKITGKGKIYDYDYLGMLKKLCPELRDSEPGNLKAKAVPKLKNVILISEDPHPNVFKWKDVLEITGPYNTDMDYLLQIWQNSVKPEDLVIIQYTSGTTGEPKGAMLTHFNVVNNAIHIAENIRLTHKDRVCGPVPFYHCFGSILLNLGCLVSAATIVIPGEHFNSRKTLEAVEKEKCTALYGVPTMFSAELNDPGFEIFDLTCLRTGIMAGAPCPIELMENVINKMYLKEITIAYGLTEASPVTHQTMPEDSLERRVSTVGKPIKGVEAKIVNPKTLKECLPGEVGEIWVRGYNVMEGYYKKPAETVKTIVNGEWPKCWLGSWHWLGGWLRTGDLGTKDKQGYYAITGRLKDMFIVAGHNVYPEEVKKILRKMFPGFFAEIQVIGVPDKDTGEIGAAWIILNPKKTLTEEEFIRKCKSEDSGLEWPQAPKYVKFVQEIPPEILTASEKIQSFKLKELLMKELGLEEPAQKKAA